MVDWDFSMITNEELGDVFEIIIHLLKTKAKEK